MIDTVLERISSRIFELDLTPAEAALQIGVTQQSLKRHLSGEYVRSDSLAKYRCWLEQSTFEMKENKDGSRLEEQSEVDCSVSADSYGPERLTTSESNLQRPLNVVDLFCGCGGLSLGFERYGKSERFRVVLGVDIEEPMIRVFNQNHHGNPNGTPIGRIVDLTDFLNETEILAYYLHHLAESGTAPELTSLLNGDGGIGLYGILKAIQSVDCGFIDNLSRLRSHDEYKTSVKSLVSQSIGQTSVIGFHKALRLPMTRVGEPVLGNLIWSDADSNGKAGPPPSDLGYADSTYEEQKSSMLRMWNSEKQKLEDRSIGTGAGQLSSSSKRIASFLEFLEQPMADSIRDLWVDWQAKRTAIRMTAFTSEVVAGNLRNLYRDEYRVDVLLGGPPCQGFSRIGRGKIRSLREQSVHVHQDEVSVDLRNRLLEQYILFVSALRPPVFLFENVRHFQAVVKTDDGAFDATEVLSDAIENISEDGLSYEISSRIVKAQQHGIPQTRERYIMAGVRDGAVDLDSDLNLAEWCLALPMNASVPLGVALEGLPQPVTLSRRNGVSDGTVEINMPSPVDLSGDPADLFRAWVRSGGGNHMTDSHIARSHREDDRGFFSLLGPGKRWMDYRCDGSETLEKVQELFSGIKNALKNDKDLREKLGVSEGILSDVGKALDGSLAIRLLLESIPLRPGEIGHHLATPTYLKKREGNHGDWLARLDSTKPSKTIVSHMAKDSYAYVHPYEDRTLSVREAARIQSFPDDFSFSSLGLVDGFRVVGNAVPPLLSYQFAVRILQVLSIMREQRQGESSTHIDLQETPKEVVNCVQG